MYLIAFYVFLFNQGYIEQPVYKLPENLMTNFDKSA